MTTGERCNVVKYWDLRASVGLPSQSFTISGSSPGFAAGTTAASTPVHPQAATHRGSATAGSASAARGTKRRASAGAGQQAGAGSSRKTPGAGGDSTSGWSLAPGGVYSWAADWSQAPAWGRSRAPPGMGSGTPGLGGATTPGPSHASQHGIISLSVTPQVRERVVGERDAA
jgi:hypothetical protein